MNLKKLLVIVGPTASGKSEMAIKLAKRHKGEIISADSRQIYRGLDIGTGKVAGQWRGKNYVYKRIRHHLIDIADPRRPVSAAQFQKLAQKVIKDIHRRGKLPIICGGTAHWVDAVVFDQKFPAVRPNIKLRKKLETMSVEQLFKQLQKFDPQRALNIDSNNKRRLVRALEIVKTTGRAIPRLRQSSPYDVTWLGLKPTQKVLHKKIDQRFKGWLKQGLLQEIERLHKHGLPWSRFNELGLDYKYGALYLQHKINYDDMVVQSATAIKRYAKRQMTWWKRNKNIQWNKKARLPSQLRESKRVLTKNRILACGA